MGENYSNGSLFILQDLKNIPFLYMPDDDIDKDKGIEYTKQMGNLNPMYDGTSEYTLPRNLEFKIEAPKDIDQEIKKVKVGKDGVVDIGSIDLNPELNVKKC